MKSLLCLLLLVGSLPAATSFTGTGVSADINVSDQHTLAVTLSGTFVATVVLEQAVSGGYVPLQAWNATVTFKPPRLTGIWRLRCSDYTSGTVTYTLTSVADNQVIYRKPNGSTAFSVDVDGLVTSAGGAISGGTIDGAPIGSTTPSTGAFTALSATGQITSTLADGTPPLVVASTTNIPNLNASTLSGATFAAPGTIGSGTPNTGAFTTISATGQITSTLVTGTAPLVVASTTAVSNLNASLLLGNTWAVPGSIGSGTPAAGAFTTLSTTGNTSAAGRITITLTDANTSTASSPMIIDHASSGTPAAGFGDQIIWRASSDTTASRNQALLLAEWATATDASRAGRFSLWAYDSAGAREGMRIEASGTVPKLGFFGATAVTQPASTDDLRTALINLGLYTTGGATPLNLNGGALTTSGVVTLSNTTDSTSATTGGVILSGGVGVPKNIVSKQGLGFGVTSVTTAAGTTTLTSASTAVQVFTGTSTQTCTLPAASVFGAGIGYVVYIKNLSTGSVTVSRAGSDTINSTASNVTTFTLAQWASCSLYSDGVSAWERF